LLQKGDSRYGGSWQAVKWTHVPVGIANTFLVRMDQHISL